MRFRRPTIASAVAVLGLSLTVAAVIGTPWRGGIVRYVPRCGLPATGPP
jgi:hypothetical protein